MIGTKKISFVAAILIFTCQTCFTQEKGLTEKDFISPNIVNLDEIDELYKSGNFNQALQKCHILIKEHADEAVSGFEWSSTLGLEALNRLFSMFRKEIKKSEQSQNRLLQDQFANNLQQVLIETKESIILAIATLETGKIRLEQGNLSQAERRFQEVLEKYPQATVLGFKDEITCYSCDALDYLTDNFLIGRWSFDSAKVYLQQLLEKTPDTLLNHYARFCLAELLDYGPATVEEVIRQYQNVPEFWFSSPKHNNWVNSREASNRAQELQILFYGREVQAKIRPEVSVAYVYPGKRPIFDLNQAEIINILYSRKDKDGLVWFKVKRKEGKIGWVLATDVEQ